MRIILTCAASLAMAALALGAPTPAPAKKKAATRKPGVVSAARKAPAKSAARSAAARKPSTAKPASATATATARHGKKTPGSTTTWRNRQTTPSSDRYKTIQDALVTKGYLSTEDATGSWSQASTEALKKFQAEQNLESNGKINSLSLIALGLGPRHDAASVKMTTDVAPAQSESPGHQE